MRESRFTPTQGRRGYAPSQLASLTGARSGGGRVDFGRFTKPPRRQFHPGDRFEYEKTQWEIIYVYRLASEPGVWFHCLEERQGSKSPRVAGIGAACVALGAGATTPRIVYEPFRGHNDASTFFRDIYRHGDSITFSTQELLKFKRLPKVEGGEDKA